MGIIILVSVNLLITVISAAWLIKMIRHQRQVINDQSQKLSDLEKYTSLLQQITQMLQLENVMKVIEIERKLMKQENEVLRREQIEKVNAQLSKEWGTVLEKRIDPKYNLIVKEFGTFIIHYIKNADFKNEDERNGFIRYYFPETQDMLFAYLNEEKNSPQSK